MASKAEAVAYWAHAVLRARPDECCRLVLAVEHRTAHQIFGSPDDDTRVALARCRDAWTWGVDAVPERTEKLHLTARHAGDSAAPAQTAPVFWQVRGYALVESHPVTNDSVVLQHYGRGIEDSASGRGLHRVLAVGPCRCR